MRIVLLSSLLSACGADPAGALPDGATVDATAAPADAAAPTLDTPPVPPDTGPAIGCPGETAITFDTAVRGTTAAGWERDITAWSAQSDVACAPATMRDSFASPFAVYSVQMPAASDWDVVVVPDPGTDASIAAAYLSGAGETDCRPVRGISVVTCETANRGGSGGEERARFNTTVRGYKLTILVGAPRTGPRGGFTLRVVRHGEAVTPGPGVDAGVGPDVPPVGGCPTQLAIGFGATVRGSTAEPGWDERLTEWFARSDVACSPATFFDRSNAPYQVYAIDMPPRSDWSVVLTPDADVDANLAAVWQQSGTESGCIPLIGRVPAAACEFAGTAPAGGVERVRLNSATSGYRVIILVNTPRAGARGGFTLGVRNFP